jgi:hypothetical protein
MRFALARHDAILRMTIAEQGGHVYKVIGDAFQAAFAYPAQALAAALAAQRALAAQPWETSAPVRVRMGVHVGSALAEGNDYSTTHTLNRVARIMVPFVRMPDSPDDLLPKQRETLRIISGHRSLFEARSTVHSLCTVDVRMSVFVAVRHEDSIQGITIGMLCKVFHSFTPRSDR